MDDRLLQEKLHIVWGSVFLTAVGALALAGVILSGAHVIISWGDLIVGAFIIATIVSVILVPLLLTVPGASPALVAGGRILLWGQVAGLLTAAGLILAAMV